MKVMGRPPSGAVAMTSGERGLRHRLRIAETLTRIEAELADTKQAVAEVQAMLAANKQMARHDEQEQTVAVAETS